MNNDDYADEYLTRIAALEAENHRLKVEYQDSVGLTESYWIIEQQKARIATLESERGKPTTRKIAHLKARIELEDENAALRFYIAELEGRIKRLLSSPATKSRPRP